MPPRGTRKTKSKAKRTVTSDSSDSDSSVNSGAKYNQPDSSDSSDDDTRPIIKPTRRMNMPKPDAPTNGNDPKPLLTIKDMTERDQQVHLESRYYEFPQGYFVLAMDMPNCDGPIKCTRSETNKKAIMLEWNSVFADHTYMQDLLCSGEFKDQSKLSLHPSDMFVQGIVNQTKTLSWCNMTLKVARDFSKPNYIH
jgi:hypothetical protein